MARGTVEEGRKTDRLRTTEYRGKVKQLMAPAGQILAILGPTATAVFLGSLFSYTVNAIGKQRVMTFAYAFVATLTLIGYAIALAGQLIVFPLLGIAVTLQQNLVIGGIFMAISTARSYVLRRVFEWLRVSGVMA